MVATFPGSKLHTWTLEGGNDLDSVNTTLILRCNIVGNWLRAFSLEISSHIASFYHLAFTKGFRTLSLINSLFLQQGNQLFGSVFRNWMKRMRDQLLLFTLWCMKRKTKNFTAEHFLSSSDFDKGFVQHHKAMWLTTGWRRTANGAFLPL